MTIVARAIPDQIPKPWIEAKALDAWQVGFFESLAIRIYEWVSMQKVAPRYFPNVGSNGQIENTILTTKDHLIKLWSRLCNYLRELGSRLCNYLRS